MQLCSPRGSPASARRWYGRSSRNHTASPPPQRLPLWEPGKALLAECVEAVNFGGRWNSVDISVQGSTLAREPEQCSGIVPAPGRLLEDVSRTGVSAFENCNCLIKIASSAFVSNQCCQDRHLDARGESVRHLSPPTVAPRRRRGGTQNAARSAISRGKGRTRLMAVF